MKVPSPYKCDECNLVKQETNHWYLLQVIPESHPTVTAPTVKPGRPKGSRGKAKVWEVFRSRLALYRWDLFPEFVDQPNTKHLCSEECVTKTVSKWMRGAL